MQNKFSTRCNLRHVESALTHKDKGITSQAYFNKWQCMTFGSFYAK